MAGGACVAGGLGDGGHAWQERQRLLWMVRILLECFLVSDQLRLQSSFWRDQIGLLLRNLSNLISDITGNIAVLTLTLREVLRVVLHYFTCMCSTLLKDIYKLIAALCIITVDILNFQAVIV